MPDDLHVVDVGAAALDQARVFAALDALADELGEDGSVAMAYLLRRRRRAESR